MPDHTSPTSSGGFDPESVGAGASRRVQSVIEGILEDAEAEAKSLVEDARERADRLILERVRLLSELTDDLLEQASEIKQRSDRLLQVLDAAVGDLDVQRVLEDAERATQVRSATRRSSDTLEAELRSATRSSSGAIEAELSPLEGLHSSIEQAHEARASRAGPSSERESAPGRGERLGRPAERQPALARVSEDARLLATQMAVAGSSRSEIERRLRDEFGIDDAGEILISVPEHGDV